MSIIFLNFDKSAASVDRIDMSREYVDIS